MCSALSNRDQLCVKGIRLFSAVCARNYYGKSPNISMTLVGGLECKQVQQDKDLIPCNMCGAGAASTRQLA